MKRIRLIRVGVFVLFLAVLGYFGSRWFTSLEPLEKKEQPFQGQGPWAVFHKKMVDLTIENFRKAGARMTPEDIENIRAQLVAQHKALRAAGEAVPEVPKVFEVTTKVSGSRGKLHEGSQTVKAIMETFDVIHSESTPLAEVDMKIPRAAWIQRCLDRGIVFEDYGDYSGLLSVRYEVIDYENNPDSELNMDMKTYYGLPPDASLEEYTNAAIDGTRRDLIAMREASEEDPTVSGGFGTPNGFIPMREGVLYVKVNEEDFSATLYGDSLSEAEEDALLFHGKAPAGLEVIYLGEDDKPLPPDVKPRFDWANYDLSDADWEAMAQNMSDADWDTMGIERDRRLEISAAQNEAQATAKTVKQTETEALENGIQSDVEMEVPLEKQFTPDLPTTESVEAKRSEGVSPVLFDKALELIDSHRTEEGLRRLREGNSKTTRQFEQKRHPDAVPARDVPDAP